MNIFSKFSLVYRPRKAAVCLKVLDESLFKRVSHFHGLSTRYMMFSSAYRRKVSDIQWNFVCNALFILN